ncbi:MAG: helix-turn-helix domain-containing protein [Defluviitaleaceae bacterium]|nr:helix-turn-helix domain-containing protein [Defluviitaleaceae bacterium]
MDEYKQWLTGFGARLRAERERQEITRIVLAERIGTKPDYISQMERGDKSPSMKTMVSLLSALNVSPDFLMTDPSKKNDDMERILDKYSGFVKQLDAGVASSLYEIMRFSAKFIKPVEV